MSSGTLKHWLNVLYIIFREKIKNPKWRPWNLDLGLEMIAPAFENGVNTTFHIWHICRKHYVLCRDREIFWKKYFSAMLDPK